jgi:BRCA2, oligonucleotide/oligosaccharide-binding, domain 1/BRCA2, helical
MSKRRCDVCGTRRSVHIVVAAMAVGDDTNIGDLLPNRNSSTASPCRDDDQSYLPNEHTKERRADHESVNNLIAMATDHVEFPRTMKLSVPRSKAVVTKWLRQRRKRKHQQLTFCSTAASNKLSDDDMKHIREPLTATIGDRDISVHLRNLDIDTTAIEWNNTMELDTVSPCNCDSNNVYDDTRITNIGPDNGETLEIAANLDREPANVPLPQTTKESNDIETMQCTLDESGCSGIRISSYNLLDGSPNQIKDHSVSTSQETDSADQTPYVSTTAQQPDPSCEKKEMDHFFYTPPFTMTQQSQDDMTSQNSQQQPLCHVTAAHNGDPFVASSSFGTTRIDAQNTNSPGLEPCHATTLLDSTIEHTQNDVRGKVESIENINETSWTKSSLPRTNFDHSVLNTNTMVGFRTSGLGNKINISADSLAKADRVLGDDTLRGSRRTTTSHNAVKSGSATTSRALPIATRTVVPTDTNRVRDGDSSSRSNPCDERETVNNVDDAIPVAAFRTAGCGSTIRVSSASLKKAALVLMCNNTSEGAANFVPSETAVSEPPMVIPNTMTSPIVAFHSAGLGKKIKVSDASLERAIQMFEQKIENKLVESVETQSLPPMTRHNEDSQSKLLRTRATTPTVDRFHATGQDIETIVSTISRKSALGIPAWKSDQGLRNKIKPSDTVKVSAFGLEKASGTLERTSDHVMHSTTDKRSSDATIPASTIVHSAEHGYDKMLNCKTLNCKTDIGLIDNTDMESGFVATPALIAFRSAGRGDEIQVSKASLAMASSLLECECDFGLLNTTDVPSSDMTIPSRVSFRSAGRGDEIQVSAASLCKARSVLDCVADGGLLDKAGIQSSSANIPLSKALHSPRREEIKSPCLQSTAVNLERSKPSENGLIGITDVRDSPSLKHSVDIENGTARGREFSIKWDVMNLGIDEPPSDYATVAPSIVSDKERPFIDDRREALPDLACTNESRLSSFAVDTIQNPHTVNRTNAETHHECGANDRNEFIGNSSSPGASPVERTYHDSEDSDKFPLLLSSENGSLASVDFSSVKLAPRVSFSSVDTQNPFRRSNLPSQSHQHIGAIEEKCIGSSIAAITPAALKNATFSLSPGPFVTPNSCGKSDVSFCCSNEVPLAFRDAVSRGVMLNKWSEGLWFGVSPITMDVNSVNACQLRFSRDTLMPLSFISNQNQTPLDLIGCLSDYKRALHSLQCDVRLVCEKWLSNHVRWIVWKLASTERRFAWFLGGKYLTFDAVVNQLKLRYMKEIRDGARPALRKVLNRDLSAGSMLILCVATINIECSNGEVADKANVIPQTESGYVLELTDGWYSLRAAPDNVLCEFIKKKTIQIGTKILISNATLVGFDNGIDPLDNSFALSKSPLLRIAANSTRLSRWNAKLGFVTPNRFHSNACNGMLLIKKMEDVYDDGGRIPLIDLKVVRRFPLSYLERQSDSLRSKSRILTEAEEYARIERYEKRRQNLIENVSEDVEVQCLKVRLKVVLQR